MDKFKNIFEGNKSAYGQLILTGETTDKGKAVGKAFIKKEPIPNKLWQDHLDGKDPALGVIPINESNLCKWGCIDVDEYSGLDHKKIIDSIKLQNFPLVTFRSKSGGAHLFLFTKDFIPAVLMQAKLKMMSEALGFGGSEIFPKQTEILVERGDTGNFLNLPYHNGTRGLRYAMDAEGVAIKLDDFYTYYEQVALTEKQVQEIIIEKDKVVKVEEAFKDGPPCLNKLAADGFGDGSRNNGLFNIAVYRKQADPDTWEDKVMEDNQTHMDPPLGFQEVKQLLGSIGKRGYDKYRCKDQPICGVCNAAKCRTKKFGVGFEEEQMPELDTLTVINSDPPQWFLNVAGKRVVFTAEELHNPNLFSIVCMKQAKIITPIPKAKDWREVYLKPLMAALVEIEALESLSPQVQIENLLYDFTVHRSKARTKEDILNKIAWTDEGFTYFRMRDFYAFAKRNNWDIDLQKTGNLIRQLKDIYVDEVRMKLKSQTPHLVKIKALKDSGAEVSRVTYQEAPF